MAIQIVIYENEIVFNSVPQMSIKNSTFFADNRPIT